MARNPRRGLHTALVTPNQLTISLHVEVPAGTSGTYDPPVGNDSMTVNRNTVPFADIGREPRRRAVHGLCPGAPVSTITSVLDADAVAVGLPLPRVPGNVLVPDALGDSAVPAYHVVGRHVGAAGSEPSHGSRKGAFRNVNHDPPYPVAARPAGVGEVATMRQPGVRARILAGTRGFEDRRLSYVLGREYQFLPGRVGQRSAVV